MSSKSKRRVTVETGNTVAEDSEKRKPSVFERLGPGAGPQRIERKYSDYDNAEKKCRPFLLNGECPFGATCKYKHVQLSRKSKTRDDDLSPENLRLKLKSGPSERSGDKQRDSDSESHDPQGRASGRSRRDKEGESRDRSQSHTRRDKETKLKSQVVVKKAGGNQDSDESGDDSESNWLNSLDYKKELELEQERQQLQRELSQLAEEEVPPPQSGSDSSPDRGRSGKPLTSPHDKRSTSPSGRGKKDKKHQTKSPPAADAREKKVSPQPPLDKARDHKKRHEAEEDSHKKHKKKKDKDKRRPPSPSPADLKAKRRDKEDADAGPSRSLQPSKRSRSSSSDSSASPPRSKDSKDKVGKVKGRKKKGRGGGGGKGDGGSGSDEAPTSKSKKWLSPLKKTLKLKKVKPASSVSDLKDEEERSKRSTSPSRRGADSRDLLAEDPMPPSRSSHDAKRADAHHDLIGKRDWDSSRARSSEKRDKKHKGKRSESPAVSGSVDRAGGSSSRRGSRTREAPFERSKGPSSRRPSHSPPPPSAPPGSSDRDRDRDRSGKRGEGRGGGGGGGGDAPYDRNNRKWEQERERGGERDRKGGGGGGDDRPKRGDRGGGSPPQGGSKPSGELYSPSQLDRDTPGPGDIPGPRGSGHARGDSSRGDDDRRGGGQNRDGRRGGGGEGRGGERGERAVGGDKGPPPSSRTQTPPKPDRYGRRGGDAEGFDGPYGGQGQDRGRGLDPERNRGGSDAREGRGEGRGGGPGEVGDREGRGRRGADGFERGGGALPQQRDRSRGGEGPGGGGREGPGGGREGPGGVRGEPGFDRPEPGRSAGGRDASRDARDNEGRDRSRDGPRDRGDNLRGGDGPRDREGRPPLGDGAKFGNSSFGAEGPRRGGQWDAGNRSGDWGPDRPDPPRDLGGGRLDERGRGAFRDDGREPGGRGGERRGGGGGRDMPGGGRDMPGGEGGVGGGPRLDRDGPRLDRSLDGGRPDREGPRLDRDGPRLDRERPDNNNPRGGERGGGERGGDGRMDRGGPDRMGPGDRLDRGGGDRSLERGEGGRMDRGDNRAGDRGDRVDRGDVRLDRGDGRMDRGGGGDRMDRGGPGREPPGGGIGPGGLDQRGGGARPGGRGGAADGRGGMRGGVMDNNNRGGGGGGGGGGPMDARGLEFERGRPGERGGNLRGGDGPGDLVGRGGVGGMRGGPDRGPDRDGRLLDRERDRERELQGMGLTMPPLGPRDRFEPPLPPDFRRGDDRGGPLPFRDDLLLPPPDAVLLRGGVGGGDRRGGGGMVVDDRFAEGPRGGGDPRGDPQQRGGHRGFDDGHMRDERILGRLPMDDRQVRGGGGGGGGGERMLPQRRGGGGGGGGGRDGGGIHPVPFEFDRPPGPQDVRGQDLLPGGGRRVPLLPTPMDELPPPRGRGGGREEFDGRDGPPGPGGRDLPRDLREERGGGGGRRGDQREGGPGFIPGVEMGGGGGRDDRVGGRRGDPRGDLEFPPPDLGPSPRGRDFPRDGPRDGPRDPFWERDGPNKDGRDNLGRGGGGDLPLRDASGRRLGGPRGGGGVPGDDMVPLDILDRGRDVLDRSREVLDRSRERGGRPDLGPRRGDRDRSPRGVDADKRNQDKRGREEKREEGGGGGGDRGSGSGSRGRDSSRDNAKDASDARSTRSADDLRDPLPLRLKDKVAAADGPPTRASSLRGGKERDSQSDGKRSPSRNRGGAGSKDRSPLDVPDRARPGLKRTRSLSPKQRRPGNNNSNNRDAPPSPAGGPPDNNNTPTPNTTTTTASRPSPAKPPGGGGKRGEDLDPSPLAGRSRTPVGTKRKLDEEILRSPAAGGAPRGNKDEIKSPGAKRAREQSKSPGRKGSRQASPATSHHSGPIGGRDMLRGGRPGGAGGGVEARFFGAHPRDRGEGGGGPGSWRDRERESANVKSEKPSEDGKGDAEKGDGTRKRPRSPLRSQGRVPDNADKGRKRWRGENYHPALVRAFEAGVSFLELKTKLGEVQDKFRLIQLQSQTRNIVARKTVLDRRYDREHVLSESDDLLLVWDCRRRALLDWFIRKDRRAQLTHFQEDAQTCVNVWSPVKDVRYLPVAEMLAGRASIIASALRHFLDGTWSDTDRADSAEKDAFRQQKLDQGRTADNAGNAGEAGGRQQDPSKGPPSSAFPPPSQSPLATEATKPNRPGGRPDSFGARGGAGGNEDHAHSAQDARFNRGADSRNEGRTAEDISLRLNQNNTDDSKDPALTMLYNHEDDYEKISSDESDFEDEKQAQQNIVGLLDIDWASLAKEEETPKPHTGSLVRRLHPAAIFSRIGLSRALAGPALFNKVKALCQEGIKVQAATPEEGSEEEKKKEDAGSGGPAVDLSLRAEVPVLHMALVRQRRERSNLLRNLGPFRRALCARRDLEIRRQLCKVDKVYEQPAVFPAHVMDTDLQKLSMQLFRQGRDFVDRKDSECDSKIELSI